jgi:transcription elongation factor GreA-like protein
VENNLIAKKQIAYITELFNRFVHSVDKEKDMMYQTTGDTGLKID